MGSSCKKKGSKDYYKNYKKAIKEGGLKGKVELLKIDCTDRCDDAPIMTFQPQNAWHVKVKAKEAAELFERYVTDSE